MTRRREPDGKMNTMEATHMRSFKKALPLLLCAAMVFSLAACGKSTGSETSASAQDNKALTFDNAK